MNETIDIAFVFDEKFADLFKVAAYSISKNTKSDLAIHVVDCGITEGSKDQIRKFVSAFENVSSIEFRVPERVDVLENYAIPVRFSTAIFYRLAIPKLFPELKRVIYLDCDTIAAGDIAELWAKDLKGCPFGAVEEDGNFLSPNSFWRKRLTLKLPAGRHYYNSGVLLIDCKQWQKSKIFERVIEFVKNTDLQLSYPEQDAMNLCLPDDEHLSLSPKYNFMPFFMLSKRCLRIIKKPVVIHYAAIKPWELSLNKTLIKILYSLGICRYMLGMFLRFWQYSDKIDGKKFSSWSIIPTIKFLYILFLIEFCPKKLLEENRRTKTLIEAP
ncbi:MAG: glycosyltransferase family 8 protein [Puniceicoccales bacterium]|jgi:lipopolysaccharide biosynthesis glycosyltransferase|nr:glycosyltransferase family 8 protein [Puniceicoccales bacterium]